MNILVIIGTPLPGSYNHALADAYIAAAEAGGAAVRVIDLARDPLPAVPTSRAQLRMPRDQADDPLDPAVASYLEDVAWADHLVFLYPQWWGTYPGALKVFIDRVFLSGFAFRYHDSGRGWDPLLTGRTARLVMTMDSPRFWNRFVYRNAAETSLKNAVLRYCGVRTRGVTRLAGVRHTDEARRRAWLEQVARLASSDAVLPTGQRSQLHAVG